MVLHRKYTAMSLAVHAATNMATRQDGAIAGLDPLIYLTAAPSMPVTRACYHICLAGGTLMVPNAECSLSLLGGSGHSGRSPASPPTHEASWRT